ncbi:N-formylglutamate amidohydrolase [uncultured Bartonella sp.]|uniref:N-formylglutamate amidohydrolase n=1 Tax=uncultured Bartonella sp. TaxID=104108 RepID=UPI00262D190D|nr:N-formylglutamate amidohydrolase [uncultured Bartonella sp.]
MNLDGIAAFQYFEPAELRVPFLFNSPHSGRIYPKSFLMQSVLDQFSIRMSEDCFVDLLFNKVVDLGAGFMTANFPRSFIDVNREAYELDPVMFFEPLPAFVPKPSMRVMAGLGTIPKIVATNVNIYDERMHLAEALDRIETLYIPYHKHLQNTLDSMRNQFGFAMLIDCHSMPGKLKFFNGGQQPDFILGDLYGHSCANAFVEYAADKLIQKGYNVSLNRPYSGGFITAHYGRPAENIHCLQIEINRSLYLDEISLEVNNNFPVLQKDLTAFAADLMAFPEYELISYKTAAE